MRRRTSSSDVIRSAIAVDAPAPFSLSVKIDVSTLSPSLRSSSVRGVAVW